MYWCNMYERPKLNIYTKAMDDCSGQVLNLWCPSLRLELIPHFKYLLHTYMASICTQISQSTMKKYSMFALLWANTLYSRYIRLFFLFVFISCCVLLFPREFNAYCKGHNVKIDSVLVDTCYIGNVNSQLFYTACINKLYVMLFYCMFTYFSGCLLSKFKNSVLLPFTISMLEIVQFLSLTAQF